MVCVSALLTIPFILSNELCAGRDVYTVRILLISSTFVVSGISTIVQTMFGTRFFFFKLRVARSGRCTALQYDPAHYALKIGN